MIAFSSAMRLFAKIGRKPEENRNPQNADHREGMLDIAGGRRLNGNQGGDLGHRTLVRRR